MAESAIEKPVKGWRKKIAQAQAIAPPPWRHYRARVFQGYLVGAMVAFAVLAILAHSIAYFTFDLTITQAAQSIRFATFDALMRFVSWFGFAPQVNFLLALGILFLYVSGLKWEALVTFVASAGGSTLGTLIKLIVVRPRPNSDLVHVITQLPDSGFPSGHVLFYSVFFGFLGFLAYTLLKPSWGRRTLLGVALGMVALVGLSRIYLGAHWASDVFGAYLLGSVCLSLAIQVYRWGKPRFFTQQPLAKEPAPSR